MDLPEIYNYHIAFDPASFDVNQTTKLLDVERACRGRPRRKIISTSLRYESIPFNAHLALSALTLIGFTLLFLSYWIFAHVITW
ncbi:unnamed protein product [Dracunculus medinensis]|uniref:Uncharacterized protein n=1 Tax=Dracunculus medinensis TaxID=318479 RepID=A0A0N4U1X3_DRAME|nr:unnamed protein product [Dracunculus medinensis]